MIRLTYLLRRRPDVSVEEFQRYWREEHGPLVAGHAGRLGILKYVQVHAVDDPANAAMAEARGGMEPPYDGVAELWFADRDTLVQGTAGESGRRAAAELVEDEARFIDLPRSPLWLNHELPQVNPTPEVLVARPRSTLAKLYFPLRCHAGQDEAEAQRYWYRYHGPLIRRQAAGAGILRYMQVHRVADELEDALREARGTVTEPYMGHAEVWVDRAQLATSTPEREEAGRRAIEDESRFIDFRRSAMWLGKEHVFVDRM
ncbi:MAG: EthD domain-containing protein [Pseudomonadota bacterium]